MPAKLHVPHGALSLARSLAVAAGKIQVSHFRRKMKVSYKSQRDPVTVVDERCERLIVKGIRERFPDHGYVGEEGSQREGEYVWVVDPLDGTTNYARGLPCFCVSIALVSRGMPLLGVIHDPLLEQTFHATKGGGAFLNRRRIRVSKVRSLKQSLVTTGFPYRMERNRKKMFAIFEKAICRTFAARRAGSAAIDLAYVAAGFTEGHFEYRLHPWDVAAGMLMVTEAGGKVTLPEGGLFRVSEGYVVASNGKVHPQLLGLLR